MSISGAAASQEQKRPATPSRSVASAGATQQERVCVRRAPWSDTMTTAGPSGERAEGSGETLRPQLWENSWEGGRGNHTLCVCQRTLYSPTALLGGKTSHRSQAGCATILTSTV